LRMQSEILQSFRSSRQKTIETKTGGEGAGSTGVSCTEGSTTSRGGPELPTPDAPALTADPSRDIAISFLRLANLDSGIVDSLSLPPVNPLAPARPDDLCFADAQASIRSGAFKWLRSAKKVAPT